MNEKHTAESVWNEMRARQTVPANIADIGHASHVSQELAAEIADLRNKYGEGRATNWLWHCTAGSRMKARDYRVQFDGFIKRWVAVHAPQNDDALVISVGHITHISAMLACEDHAAANGDALNPENQAETPDPHVESIMAQTRTAIPENHDVGMAALLTLARTVLEPMIREAVREAVRDA